MENRVFYTFTDENDANLAFHVEDNEINVIKNGNNFFIFFFVILINYLV